MSAKKFNPKARANEIAAQLKAAEAAQAAYDATIDEALEKAGRNRVEFVEVLYEHFGIEPEVTQRKDKDGNVVLSKNGEPVTVKTDKDESVRIEKLAQSFERLVEQADKTGRRTAAQSDDSKSHSRSSETFG